MSTTLTHPISGTVTLPDGLSWTDEFTWQKVLQTSEYTTTGALVLDAWAKQAGRPITLEGSETSVWCPRSTLDTLSAWAEEVGRTFTLSYRGVNHTVVFNHESGAISAEPLVDFDDPIATDYYIVTFRFLEL